jgi:hypothetical protein
MKKFLFLSIMGTLLPVVSFAQNWEVPASDDGVAYASIFVGNFSLLLSIVIGLIATALVFRSARKLGGGLFGLVLKYISIGMLFVVLGAAFTFVNSWFIGLWFNIISTALFALGYIFMVIGANRLLKGIMNT